MQAALDLSMPLARAARDEGMARAADHQDALEPGWAASCYRVLAEWSRGREFSSEDFRDHLAAINFPCDVPKALGGVFQRAARAGVITKIGFRQSRERHCSPTPLWRGVT